MLCAIACVADSASAQFYGTVGGVGRQVLPGYMRGPGSLRAIGGFQRVGANTALLGAERRGVPIGSTANGVPAGSSAVIKYRASYGSAVNDAVHTFRYDASFRLPLMLKTPDDAMRWDNRVTTDYGRDRLYAWQDRGLSLLGQSFAGGNVGFNPASGLVPQNPATSSVITRTDWAGRTSQIGRGVGSLWSALGPPVDYRSSRRGLSLDQSNNPVYRAAEVAVRSEREQSSEGDLLLPAEKNVRLNDLIASRLNAKMKSYIDKGRNEFKSRRYSDAYNSFVLADTIQSDAPDAKLGVIFSAIATSQYVAASNALLSMANHNNPDLFGHPPVDMRTYYGDEPDFAVRYQALQDYVRASGSPDMRALYAFILWGRGDRAEAQREADRAAASNSADPTLAKFAGMMRAAPAGAGS
jgi:hypothetical protein